jgi:radical SAM superfamily enzyme YgiQ (UPF0313 family)
MRILLISPSSLNAGEWTIPYFDLRKNVPPLGVSILKEVIKQNHEVEMLFYGHTINNVKKIIKEAAKSDVTGFSVAHFFQYPATRSILEMLREEEIDTKIVLGGTFSTYHAHYLCEDGVDIVVNGEGEIAFPHLLEVLETGESLKHVQGITYKEDGTVIDTGPAQLAELNSVPLPRYEDFPLAEAHYRYMACETSRGCPNNCTFCAIYPHENWRAFSPEKSVAAMKHAQKYLKYSKTPYIFLADSNFAGNVDRVKQMADLIEDEIPSYTPTRLDHVSEEIVKYFQKIGFKAVCTGVESGSESTLAHISKHINVGSVEKKLHLLIAHGIIPRTSFIFGLPGEDKNSVITTVKRIRHMVELFGEDIHVLVFPFRQDTATTYEEFKRYKSLETGVNALISMHDQKFRQWALALLYLVNVYHSILDPEEQIAVFDALMKSPPKTVIRRAQDYDGNLPSWLRGIQRYYQLDGNQ